jgi:RNA polymerase sigma-70 factor (ECF subfamily)
VGDLVTREGDFVIMRAAVGNPSFPRMSRDDLLDANASAHPTALAVATGVQLRTARVTALVQAHFEFVWRVVRRFGIPESGADDAAQQVFIVLTRRIDDVAPGTERSFLFRTAVHVAGDAMRTRARSREKPDESINTVADSAPSPEDALDRQRALESIQEILSGMDEDERAVFVLFELEGVPAREIAEIVDVPPGTVASRLRRAREYFHGAVKRLHAREGRRP